MRNSIFSALIVVGAMLGLGSCKSSAGGAKPLTIALFSEVDILNIMKEHLKLFEKESGIKVEPVYVAYNNFSEKLLTQIAAGQEPDLIWTEVSQFPQFQGAGAFQPLDDLLKADPLDLKQYFPELLSRFTVDGKIYAIPQDTAPIACLYYNKTMFKEAGVKFPKGDWTWNEFLAACKKLVKKDAEGNVTQWAFMDNYGPDWEGIIYSNGGQLVDDVKKPTRCVMDSPEAVEAIQFLADLMNVHKVHPPMAARNTMLSLGQDEFMQGRLAMVRTGLWITPTLKKSKIDWDIAPFPAGPRAKGGKANWSMGGSGYAISKHCVRQAEAWKLAKFLSSKASQKSYIKTGYVQPAIISLAKSDEFVKSGPPANKSFLNAAVGRGIYSPMHPRWIEAQLSIITVANSDVWLGNVSAKDAMTKVAKDVNALIFKK